MQREELQDVLRGQDIEGVSRQEVVREGKQVVDVTEETVEARRR